MREQESEGKDHKLNVIMTHINKQQRKGKERSAKTELKARVRRGCTFSRDKQESKIKRTVRSPKIKISKDLFLERASKTSSQCQRVNEACSTDFSEKSLQLAAKLSLQAG